MPARDRLMPLAAGATMVVCGPMLGTASSQVVRVPMKQTHTMRVLHQEASSVYRYTVPVRTDVTTQTKSYDSFTAADMAVLDAVDQVVAEDTFDYDSLLDYDDD